MIQAVIFDCFGVLLIDATQSLLEKYSKKKDRLLEVRRQADAGFLNRSQLLEQFSEIIGMSTSEVDAVFRSEHQINQPLVEAINALKKQNYQIGMITNLGSGWIDELVPRKIQDLFDDIVVSGEVKMTKPSSEIYELSLYNLNVQAKEAVFIDDIEANCWAAKDVGMQAIHYINIKNLTDSFIKLDIKI